jgi:hypothetical protein
VTDLLTAIALCVLALMSVVQTGLMLKRAFWPVKQPVISIDCHTIGTREWETALEIAKSLRSEEAAR